MVRGQAGEIIGRKGPNRGNLKAKKGEK